ncbi:probable transmembrane reductase CYB561D1 [Acipenser ruthenus]|uniref:probable transmembrane reductase CYB561D1 n=1 Tax=Acipenser ruthenus TaxID=7906 RepID=UPI002741D792|nr:probable transmembrane reductase CYB561D1 [Acipenser ruthenus]XP_058859559.1 probable transmembrane reductase CYB561D1 [Acipenser ruthenus]
MPAAVFHPHCSVAEEGLGMKEFWLYVWLRKVGIVAAHIISLGLTIFITLLSRPGTSLFSWHPVCMSIGFSLCMTEGVLLFSSEGSPFCFQSRKGKVQLHWVLQALVAIAGGTGLGFIVASKNVSERPHLTSWHSLLGVATLVAVGCQVLCGVCLLFPKRVSSVARLRLYHATCGLVTYLLATGTLVLAMCSDWFQGTIKGALWYVCVLLLLCPALVVMNQITNAYLPTYQRRRSRYESDHI